jgi:DNA repair exonuclease SbcCD ATPase subunit
MQHRNQRLSLKLHQRPPRPQHLLNQQLNAMARDLAVLRRSIEEFAAKQEHLAAAQEQLAAKQEQMAQNIATLQAAEKDIIQTRSSPPLSGPVSPPPRKKARRVAPRKLDVQASSVSPPTFRPQ